MGEGLRRAKAAALRTQPMTPKQRLVLLRTAELYERRAVYPDHHDIAVECGRAYSSADWAHEPLRRLLALGYVEVAGRKPYGGRCWRVTEAGLEAISTTTV